MKHIFFISIILFCLTPLAWTQTKSKIPAADGEDIESAMEAPDSPAQEVTPTPSPQIESDNGLKSFIQKNCPFSIYQATNPAFVRHFDVSGKVERIYTPAICTSEGKWSVVGEQLIAKENVRCYKDFDNPSKGFEKKYWQKLTLTISRPGGQLSLNGILKSSNNSFLLN